MSDFTSQSTEEDRVCYPWVFRVLQVKDSPDVTQRKWVIDFRRFEGQYIFETSESNIPVTQWHTTKKAHKLPSPNGPECEYFFQF